VQPKSELDERIGAVLEIVIDGLTDASVKKAMEVGMRAVCRIGAAGGIRRLSAGNYGGKLGQFQYHLQAGTLTVQGSAGALAACEMAGGTLTIDGNAGDFAASTLPGSMDGMRGGTLIVRGHVGARFADRMRRGTAVVFGDAGDFLASRLVAGTVLLGGRCGAHPGYGMRRGSLVFAAGGPEAPPTFVPAIADAPVFWQLLARDLARHGGVFAGLPARRIDRQLGDLAADGKGEWIAVR
jgi:formylmethanofuran dehydrogenase subunit C